MKKNNYYFVVFLFFLIISFLIPYTGDDWNNLIGHSGNVKNIINVAISNYNTFEGRFFSRIFDLLLNYYKPIWVIINAFGMTFLYYFILKIVDSKKIGLFSVLVIEALLLVDEETFSQIYVWITGNITYFIPMIFLLFIIYINRKVLEKKNTSISYNKILYVLLPILTFIFSMFVENVTVGIITIYLLVIIYDFIRNKKINVLMIICMLISICGLYLMLSSPGTISRSNTMSEFEKLSIFGKVLKTFPRQMNHVFIKNSFLIFLLIIVIVTIIRRNYSGVKRYLLYIFMTIIPFVTSLQNVYRIFRGHGIRYIDCLLDCNNWFVLIYWILFLIVLISLIIRYTKVNRFKLLFFFLIALINNASMLISPLAGGRTSFLSTMMLIICTLLIIDDLNIKLFDNSKFLKINKFLCFGLMSLFLIYYFGCYVLDMKRENYIYHQLKQDKEEIETIMLPGLYLWNANPWEEWHLYTFKSYYNIPDSKKIVIKRIWECEL